MKKITLSILILLTCGTVYSHKRTPKAQSTEITCEQQAKIAFDQTNEFRAHKGLSKLKWNQKIADIAKIHSKNMALGHVDFGHDGFDNRVDQFPFSISEAAENVYMSNTKKEIVGKNAVDSWIKSPGHHKNLIGSYQMCGIGVYKNSDGYWYFTQLFATARQNKKEKIV